MSALFFSKQCGGARTRLQQTPKGERRLADDEGFA
jgi:hypothetical protein